MSDNKYIIDKDSLTGIADAVRNKLGTGEATTDPQTGDIVYPEDKGYYLKETAIAKISGFGWSETGYNGNFSVRKYPLISSTSWNEAVGEPWYSAEITLINVGGRSYDMSVRYVNGSKRFSSVSSSTYTVSVPNGSTYFQLAFSNDYNSSVQNESSSLGSLTVVFKDAEGNIIKPKQPSYKYQWDDSGSGTKNFETISAETPIPFSIDDIQNKITNHLIKNDRIKTAIFMSSGTFEEKQIGKTRIRNYFSLNDSSYLNFDSSDPSYITTKIPDLTPENIVAIYFRGRNGSNNYRSFVFDSSQGSIKHYTSASISDGQRLSSATDYYIFPDTDGTYANRNQYGIVGMWDANNKILDLCLQQIIQGFDEFQSNATTAYPRIPLEFIIIYKEA